MATLFCALAMSTTGARGAILTVEDVMPIFTTQTPTSAIGTLEFNLKFITFNGPPVEYDFFSSQMTVSRILGAPSGIFTLDEVSTEDTGPITPYWLPSPPTNFQNASTQGNEFRFSDFVSISQGHMPATGDILAHYVINFDISSAQFGEYEIGAGDPAFNLFRSDLVNPFPNTITPGTITLIPEPSTGLMFCFVAVTLLRRRR
ncbi:MAG: PEP-CTERM sorting domain-containing protein [Phycisphaerae bacterium]